MTAAETARVLVEALPYIRLFAGKSVVVKLGGAAIDAYLALATPFVAWALWRARSTWQWGLAALFALVWVYVCLTTFARGVYLGVLTAIVLLAFLRLLGGTGWRRWAGVAAAPSRPSHGIWA